MTTRTKGPRCVTCSGQKCLHVNLYKEANEDPVVGRKSERQKERAKSVKTTAVVGDPKLPMEPSGEGREEEDEEHDEESVQSEFNPYLFKGKKSNVFGVKITYPPTDEEKDDIKRINTEDIFPDDLAAPSLEEGEECKHGNKFSPKLEAINIESRNMIIHHSQDTKDSRSSSLVLYALSTEGNVCDCKKHFTGNIVGSISIVLHLILLLLLLLSLKHILQVRTSIVLHLILLLLLLLSLKHILQVRTSIVLHLILLLLSLKHILQVRTRSC